MPTTLTEKFAALAAASVALQAAKAALIDPHDPANSLGDGECFVDQAAQIVYLNLDGQLVESATKATNYPDQPTPSHVGG